jgi:dTDP-L-rhamnose 4-epimerase
MNVLVTGGAGFIGSHTVDALLALGHRVRVLDNLEGSTHARRKPNYLATGVEFVFGDVRDRRIMEYALHGIEVVYHFAARQNYLSDFSRFFHVNTVGTSLLFETIVKHRFSVVKVILASSQAVLGEGLYQCQAHGRVRPGCRPDDQLLAGNWEHACPRCGEPLAYLPTPEDQANPLTHYALSKHSAEMIALQLGRRYSIPTVVLRYSIVQGARQSPLNLYSGALRIFFQHLLAAKAPIIYEDGCQVRDYINVADVVAANVLVLEDDRADFRVFNVGGGTPVTVLELYRMIQEEVGLRPVPLINRFYRHGDSRHVFSDTQQLRVLGWAPRIPVSQSIKEYRSYLVGETSRSGKFMRAARRMRQQEVVREVERPIRGLA